jgi:hypothetical protein
VIEAFYEKIEQLVDHDNMIRGVSCLVFASALAVGMPFKDGVNSEITFDIRENLDLLMAYGRWN